MSFSVLVDTKRERGHTIGLYAILRWHRRYRTSSNIITTLDDIERDVPQCVYMYFYAISFVYSERSGDKRRVDIEMVRFQITKRTLCTKQIRKETPSHEYWSAKSWTFSWYVADELYAHPHKINGCFPAAVSPSFSTITIDISNNDHDQ